MKSVAAADLFEGLDTAVVVVDPNLLVAGMNPAAENLLGVSRRRATGSPLLPLLDDDETLKRALASSLESGQTYAQELLLAPTAVHGETRQVECRVTPIGAHGTDSLHLLVEMSDITRRMRISRENALLIQHGAGRQMVRQLAHEIKNPLGGLRGAAQLLRRQLASEDLREYTDVIISEADRLVALVDTLLGPGGPPNKRSTNIHELIEYVLRIIEPELGGIRIVRDYDPGLPALALDADQIVQALLNLARNACAALEGSGTLTLRTRATLNFTIGDERHPTVATVEIEDDGPGIPASLQDSVFYPLVTSRADGTGLGLPAAQELISRHRGLIEFESRPGRTVFSVHLPLAAMTEGAQ
ncbi:MAG: nitrogen regulation protein NR(II) [Woeseiaceae bacterium]|nr:nitrogen regulation protein NR(II) [Woeseiaceae bacterium]